MNKTTLSKIAAHVAAETETPFPAQKGAKLLEALARVNERKKKLSKKVKLLSYHNIKLQQECYEFYLDAVKNITKVEMLEAKLREAEEHGRRAEAAGLKCSEIAMNRDKQILKLHNKLGTLSVQNTCLKEQLAESRRFAAELQAGHIKDHVGKAHEREVVDPPYHERGSLNHFMQDAIKNTEALNEPVEPHSDPWDDLSHGGGAGDPRSIPDFLVRCPNDTSQGAEHQIHSSELPRETQDSLNACLNKLYDVLPYTQCLYDVPPYTRCITITHEAPEQCATITHETTDGNSKGIPETPPQDDVVAAIMPLDELETLKLGLFYCPKTRVVHNTPDLDAAHWVELALELPKLYQLEYNSFDFLEHEDGNKYFLVESKKS